MGRPYGLLFNLDLPSFSLLLTCCRLSSSHFAGLEVCVLGSGGPVGRHHHFELLRLHKLVEDEALSAELREIHWWNRLRLNLR